MAAVSTGCLQQTQKIGGLTMILTDGIPSVAFKMPLLTAPGRGGATQPDRHWIRALSGEEKTGVLSRGQTIWAHEKTRLESRVHQFFTGFS